MSAVLALGKNSAFGLDSDWVVLDDPHAVNRHAVRQRIPLRSVAGEVAQIMTHSMVLEQKVAQGNSFCHC